METSRSVLSKIVTALQRQSSAVQRGSRRATRDRHVDQQGPIAYMDPRGQISIFGIRSASSDLRKKYLPSRGETFAASHGTEQMGPRGQICAAGAPSPVASQRRINKRHQVPRSMRTNEVGLSLPESPASSKTTIKGAPFCHRAMQLVRIRSETALQATSPADSTRETGGAVPTGPVRLGRLICQVTSAKKAAQ